MSVILELFKLEKDEIVNSCLPQCKNAKTKRVKGGGFTVAEFLCF